jgi:hypothetical protein
VSANQDWPVIEVRGPASPDELAAVLIVLSGDGGKDCDQSATRGPIARWRDLRRAAVTAAVTRKTRSRKGS